MEKINGSLIVARVFAETFKGRVLDANNIEWKMVDGKWIGKRAVWTKDWRACWLEETTRENVLSWDWHGEDADYDEIFEWGDALKIKT